MALCYCFLQGSRKLIDWIWMMLSDLHWRLGSYEYFGPFARCCGMIFWDTAGVLRWFSCRVQVIVLFMMLVYSFFFNLLVSQLGGPRGDWRCCCCSFRVVKPPWGVPNIGVPQMDGIYGKIPWKLMMTGGTPISGNTHMFAISIPSEHDLSKFATFLAWGSSVEFTPHWRRTSRDTQGWDCGSVVRDSQWNQSGGYYKQLLCRCFLFLGHKS